ncbi:MAG: AAA family ATPase [Microcoleaceae cyanobacterium]
MSEQLCPEADRLEPSSTDHLYDAAQASAANQQALKKLVRSLRLSQGQFSLILVRCNYLKLQLQVLKQIEEQLQLQTQHLTLPQSVKTLYSTIAEALEDPTPAALFVLGLETVKDLDHLLSSTNQVRDEFRKQFKFPIVLWINDEIATKLIRLAPDFKSWAAAMIKFDLATCDLIYELKLQASILFALAELKIRDCELPQAATPSSETGESHYSFSLSSQRRRELDAAWRDLENRGYQLSPSLEASRQFILGRDNDACDRNELARKHYQNAFLALIQHDTVQQNQLQLSDDDSSFEQSLEQSLEISLEQVRVLTPAVPVQESSQAVGSSRSVTDETLEQALAYSLPQMIDAKAENNSWANGHDSNFHSGQFHSYLAYRESLIECQGIVLFYVALTYQLQAARTPSHQTELLEKARTSLSQCQQVFEQAGRPDLVAGVMSYVGDILQRLQAWAELETIASKVLKMHLTYGTPRQLAKDYGLMAEIAIYHQKWSQAHKLARLALIILPKSDPLDSRGRYLLLLAQSHKHLGEWDKAVEALESAQAAMEPGYDPQLYIRILSELRSIYYAQRQYVQAFRLKQKEREIEHQYGFRAFIGANQLQAPKQAINPSSLQTDSRSNMAEEIIASCRQQDIDKLLHRLGRDDYKLIVIHGRSGVGKSSLVNAGLVPALKSISLSARTVLPVVMHTYTNWVRELERSLSREILNQEEIQFKPRMSNLKQLWSQVITQASQRSWVKQSNEPPASFVLNPASFVLKYLRLNAERNILTVLVFDQFEEFFFVNNAADIRVFSEFLRVCLNLPFVKIVVSIREDYLHYLLECEELATLDAIDNNILNRKHRYSLRDFSKVEAQAVIEQLTQRAKFELEPDLIHALVEDLADTKGEVRPIELQVVGAQLQEEEPGITTLEQYRHLGPNPKAELIKHSIEQVIQDCGPENKAAAWDVLFALTDDKLTRPIRTRQELLSAIRFTSKPESESDGSVDLETEQDSFVDVILESGLLLRRREKPDDRYQLLHDYLVVPIRQRYALEEKKRQSEIQRRLHQAQDARSKAEAAQKSSQQKLVHRNQLLKQLLCVSLVTTIGLAFATRSAYQQKQLANIASLTAASDALYFSNQKFDAILESLRAAQRLQRLKRLKLWGDLQDTETQIAATLQQGVYGIHEQNRLEGHSDVVWDVGFHPTGQFLASGGTDNTIRLWTTEGKSIKVLRSHEMAVTDLSFSPDGTLLASASQDRTIKLWQLKLENSEMVTTTVPINLKGHESPVNSISFSPEGEILASASKDQTVKLWNPTGQLLKTLRFHPAQLNWVTFSPDGQFIATAGNDSQVRIADLNGNVAVILQHSSKPDCRIHGVDFSPDGRQVVTVGEDGTAKLWDRSGKLLKTLRGHGQAVYHAVFSPDSQTVAVASDDKTIKLWSVNGTLLQTFKGHGDRVTNLSFSPDGKSLASSSYDKSVRLRQVKDIPLKTLKGHRDWVVSVEFDPKGELLVSADRAGLVQLRDRDGKLLQALPAHEGRVSAARLDPKGRYLVTAGFDQQVHLWRPVDLTQNGADLQKSGWFRWSQGLKRSKSNETQFAPFSLERSWRAHDGHILSADVSPDGKWIVTGSKDQTVKLWTPNGELIQTLTGHQGRINGVRFSPDGRMIASASDDGTIKLWNLDGKLLRTIHAHEDTFVQGVSFSPDGRTIASAGYDNTVKLWNRRTGKRLHTLLKGSSDSIANVTFSPDSQLVASASYDGRVRLWSRRDGALLKTLVGHTNGVMDVSFSPDSTMLASASRDKTVIVWNLNLNDLVEQACEWVGDYLEYNRKVDKKDRSLCQPMRPIARRS